MKNKYDNKKGLLLAVLFCWLVACQPPDIPTNITTESSLFDTLTITELEQLQTGDVLLRKGFGWVSETIADYLDEAYPITHCGLVIKQSSDSIAILHTLSNERHNGMLLEPLASYCQQSQKGSLIAVRLRASQEDKERIILETKYLLAQKIPFDLGFDDRDSSKLYCIEMLRNVYQNVLQKDILARRATDKGMDVLCMDNLLDTTNFDILFNHFDEQEKGEPRTE